ncbi:MAG: hypothetical protein QNK03_04725 [Myxococcota bacterium]|nr:hypothetical protein [Myxococcota bacterium]
MHETTRLAGLASGPSGWLALALAALWATPAASQPTIDLCGCAGDPTSLGAFVSSDDTTWPPGTTVDTGPNPDAIVIPVEPGQRLVFDSFRVDNNPLGQNVQVRFERNDANDPIRLLVAGDLFVGVSDEINLEGVAGTAGSASTNGRGGLGGPGGFRGGDGAYQRLNGESRGGDGQGPGGGAGGIGVPSPIDPEGGSFFGLEELRPLVGGAGGGGGFSATGDESCSGGGGGGGGGAFLAVANGTITVTGKITTKGGGAGSLGGSACSSGGAGGSGGAIRLVASLVEGAGTLDVSATAGGSPGQIRIEAFESTFTGTLSPTSALSQVLVPGPVRNPLDPTVRLTAIDGEPVPALPQGFRGLTLDIPPRPAPGPVTIDLEAQDVPGGTTVEVSIKPRVGGQTVVREVELELGDCDTAGLCTAAFAEDLAAGAYYFEARATFMAP